MTLSGRKVLVTGGSGGIGSEIARALLARGAHVLITGRSDAALECTRAMVSQGPTGDRIDGFAADLSDRTQIERLAAHARQWRGGVDILVNNAGASEFGLLEETPATAIERVIATNVVAPLMLCRSLLPHLQTRQDAHIVNIGSVFGAIGYPGFSVYSATKFALRGFSEALRRELDSTSVHVHHFAPRATRTAFNAGRVDALNQELGVATDTPREVAEQICALLVAGRSEATLGWPEKLFVKVNALLPGLVDGSIIKQLPVIRKFARSSATGHGDAVALGSLPPDSTVTS